MKGKILITEGNASYQISLINLLRAREYDVIEVPKNGNEILRMIDLESPNIVIMDAFMAGKDAIGVMQSFDSYRKSIPYFFITTFANNNNLDQELMTSGASYIIYIPYDPNIAAKIIGDYISMQNRNFAPTSNQRFTEESVAELLHKMGMPSYLKGYMKLKEIIMYCLKNPDSSHAVTKVLYPSVAEKFSMGNRVERNIRYAIELTWTNGNKEFLNKYFPHEKSKRFCPSNAEFIAAAVEYIKYSKGEIYR